MLIYQNGKFIYSPKITEEYFIKKVIIQLACKDFNFAKRLFNYFSKFKIEIDSSAVVQVSLQHSNFATLAIKSKLINKLDDNEIKKIIKHHPQLITELLSNRPTAIFNYEILNSLQDYKLFITYLLKNPSEYNRIPEYTTLDIALKDKNFADYLLTTNNILNLRSYDINKIALKHPDFAFKLISHFKILELLSEEGLISLCCSNKQVALFCINQKGLGSTLNFTEVLKASEEMALLGLQKKVKADWVKIAQQYASVTAQLHLYPEIFKGFKNGKELLNFSLLNEKLALELLKYKEFETFIFIYNSKLSYAHQSFVEKLFEDSLYYFDPKNIEYSWVNILHYLTPYPSLANSVLDNENFKLIASKYLNYYSKIECEFESFISEYKVDPIAALKKINQLSSYEIIWIAEYHTEIALLLLKHKDILLKGDMSYWQVARAQIDFAKKLLAAENEDLLNALGIDQIVDIAYYQQDFALFLLENRIDILDQTNKDLLLSIMIVNPRFRDHIASDVHLMKKWFTAKNEKCYKIAVDNENFALNFVKNLSPVDSYSIIPVAIEHESIAMELLNHPNTINKMWFSHIIDLAKKHKNFAIKMLSLDIIIDKLNNNLSNYKDVIKVSEIYKEFAIELSSHLNTLSKFFCPEVKYTFLNSHPELIFEFLKDGDLSGIPLFEIAIKNKKFAMYLLKEHISILACYSYSEKLTEIAVLYEDFALELLNHQEILTSLCVSDIAKISTCHEKFLLSFMSQNNLWEQLYGFEPKDIKHEKLIFDLFLTQQVYAQKELATIFFEATGGTAAAALGNRIQGILMILCAIATNPLVIDHLEASALDDPYFNHMPKESLDEAISYSLRMGGEDHDISGCIIF